MLYQSAATLGIAYAALLVLAFLSAVRIRSLLAFRRTEPDRFRRGFPSWAASLAGVLAIISLGLVIPLEVIDAALGGTNITNFVQSALTVLAFWFFRESVRQVVFDNPPQLPRWLLGALIVSFAIPFFLIEDRGPTSSGFMADNAHDPANIAYNVIYMGILTWILADMIWALRHQRRGEFLLFLVGAGVLVLATIDEIVYITTAWFAPAWFSTATYDAFYVLFFGGILVVLAGWTWVLIVERDYLGQLQFRFDSLRLAVLMLRTRHRVRHAVVHVPEQAATLTTSTKSVTRRLGSATKPRLRAGKYRSGASERRSAAQMLATDTGLDVVIGLLGANAEDTAYRLVILIRNLVTRYDQQLTEREEGIVARIESRYPGYEPGGVFA